MSEEPRDLTLAKLKEILGPESFVEELSLSIAGETTQGYAAFIDNGFKHLHRLKISFFERRSLPELITLGLSRNLSGNFIIKCSSIRLLDH